MSKIASKLIATLLAASFMLAPVSVYAQEEASVGLALEEISETDSDASLEENEITDEESEETDEDIIDDTFEDADPKEESETKGSFKKDKENTEEGPVPTVTTVKEAMNGVVQINTVFRDDENQKHIILGGAGILIGDPEKTEYVVTNSHIVNPDQATKEAAYKYYKIPNKDNSWDNIDPYVEIVFEGDVTVTCTVVNSSENLDFSVLQLPSPNLNRTPLTFLVKDQDTDNKPYSETDPVYGLGFPEGVSFENPAYYPNKDVTMSSGKIANVTDYNGAVLIQHDAKISVNNCGGPLLNDDGLVIGMNELTTDSNNYYSLDATEITKILDSLGIEYNKMTNSEYEKWLHRNDDTKKKDTKPFVTVIHNTDDVVTKNTIPTWLIIVLIAIGVLVLGLIAGFIIMIVRQSKREDSKDKKEKKKSKKNEQQIPTYDRFGMPVNQTMNPAQRPDPHVQIQSNSGSFAKGNETTTLNTPAQPNETTVLGTVSGSTHTTFLGTLIRRKNGENIVINKNEFTIGKDSLNIDFRIADNSAVSRRHATIRQAGSYIIIEDNFSTNGTFVNGTRLAEGQTTPIKSGDVIVLANEEFDYRI